MADMPQRPGTPGAPHSAADGRREWQVRVAAQHTGGMSAPQQAQLRRAAAQRPPQAGAGAAPAVPQSPAPVPAPRPVSPQAPAQAFPGGQSRPVRISRTPAAAPPPRADALPPQSSAVPRPAAPVPAPRSTPAPASRPAAGSAPRPVQQRPEAAPAPRPAAQSTVRPAEKPVARHTKKPLPRALRILRAVLAVPLTAVKIAALAVIPLFLFWYGYTVDRNGWFQGDRYEREIALAMLDGKTISNFEQMDERQIMKLYARNLQQTPAAIALGSSRILQLNRALVGDESFVNVGMIGAEYPDVYTSYYLFDRVGRCPGTVIFSIDAWLFSAGTDANTFKRVDMQMWNEYQYNVMGRTDVDVTQAQDNMNYWLALTSPAFFCETMDYYTANRVSGLHPAIVEGDVLQQKADAKMPDGSILYNAEFRNAPPETVHEREQKQILSSLVNCEDFPALDAEHTAMFDQFIRYMESKGSRVVFFLAPYSPFAYDWILNFPQRYSGFFQVENWVRQYAAEHGIPVYGSYDPQAVGCDTGDFYDAWHVRDTGIAKFFPGLPAIDAARSAGTLPDPLAVSPRLPTTETDPVL